MRRVLAFALSAAIAVGLGGCTGGGTVPTAEPRPARSTAVFAQSTVGTGSSAARSADGSATSIPWAALKGDPGARGIVLATGTPRISRDKAIARVRPKQGTLVSAVYVVLPTAFMRGVLNDPKDAEPTKAWMVTYTGVSRLPHWGKAATAPQSLQATETQANLGDMTAVFDARSGEQLLLAMYPTPK
jgi:hypothetical protein